MSDYEYDSDHPYSPLQIRIQRDFDSNWELQDDLFLLEIWLFENLPLSPDEDEDFCYHNHHDRQFFIWIRTQGLSTVYV